MVSRITGSVGKGLAAITMDKEFQQKRREEMNRAPKDFGESLAKGGKGLLKVATSTSQVSQPRCTVNSVTNRPFVCRGSWAESQESSPSLWRVSKLLPHCHVKSFFAVRAKQLPWSARKRLHYKLMREQSWNWVFPNKPGSVAVSPSVRSPVSQ